MAGARLLVASFLTFIGHCVASTSLQDEQLKASLIRRHDRQEILIDNRATVFQARSTPKSTSDILPLTKQVSIRDSDKDNKKCGLPGSQHRVFDKRDAAATQEACAQACETNADCIAWSGEIGSWCIGCEVDLDATHTGAQAYKKELDATHPCNLDLPLATTASPNTCTKGDGIVDPVLCELAAQRLGFAFNGTVDATWSTNAIPDMPKNCSVLDGVVHYNNHPGTPVNGYSGRGAEIGVQICHRKKYEDPDPADGCPADYEEIGESLSDGFNACHMARRCMIGIDGCGTPEFDDNHTVQKTDRPQGCYREPAGSGVHGSTLGCFAYNDGTPGSSVQGRTVCRLTAAWYTAHAAAVQAVAR